MRREHLRRAHTAGFSRILRLAIIISMAFALPYGATLMGSQVPEELSMLQDAGERSLSYNAAEFLPPQAAIELPLPYITALAAEKEEEEQDKKSEKEEEKEKDQEKKSEKKEEQEKKQEKKKKQPATGVIEKNGNYYYKNPKTGKIQKKAGFVKWKGDRYYVQKGGKIITSKTFKVGKYKYRARKNGKIAVGVYRWGKERKLYYSSPKTGRWITVKSHRCQKEVKWKGQWYFIQTNSEVASDRPVVVNNMPYYADSDGVCTEIKVNKTSNAVVKIARKQIGKYKKSQVSKFWTWYYGTRFVNTDVTPWCGSFVGWCYRKAGKYGKIKSVGNVGYVPRYTSFANRRGKWVKKTKAKDGDIIIFGRNRHVGLVERVYKGYIYTIEGNSGPDAEIGTGLPGAVTRRVYKLSDPDIKGVIHP